MIWFSWLFVLIGIWLVFSPVLLGFSATEAAWNNVIIGVLIITLGLVFRNCFNKCKTSSM